MSSRYLKKKKKKQTNSELYVAGQERMKNIRKNDRRERERRDKRRK